MAHRILLNDREYHIGLSNLPCLITYKEKSGGSQLSISLVADMFLRGEKILFITAYPPGKDNFFELIKGKEEKAEYITDASKLNSDARAIVLESGNKELLLSALNTTALINKRTVFVKNIEFFGEEAQEKCLGLSKIILSGNLDECANKDAIARRQYKTIIAFSQPKTPLPFTVPSLERFVGYLKECDKGGLIKIEM